MRYAYANFPQCAMFNKYNLPAGPFVTELKAATTTTAVAAKEEAVAVAVEAPTGVCTTPPSKFTSSLPLLVNRGYVLTGCLWL